MGIFGEVIASRQHLAIEAADVSKRSLRDAAAHRQGVTPVYNAYGRVPPDQGHILSLGT
jgi:hypothetical protein